MKKITLVSIVFAAIVPATVFVVSEIGIGSRNFIGSDTSADMPIDSDIDADKPVIGSQGVGVELLPSPKASPEIILLDNTLGKDRFKNLGWWGQVSAESVSIRQEPTTQSKQLAIFSSKNRVKILSEVPGETIGTSSLWYKIDGGEHPGAFIFSEFVTPIPQPEAPASFEIPAGVNGGQYWVDVDLSKKVLTLFLYDQPVFSTYVAIGVPVNPTLPGTFKIWSKLEKTRMRGRPPAVWHFYDLANVPWVLYYNGGRALHGTYWHDQFGTSRSAGCTNLTQGDAKFLYEKLNVGDVVYNHY